MVTPVRKRRGGKKDQLSVKLYGSNRQFKCWITPAAARLMLKDGQAVVVNDRPFSIRERGDQS